MWKLALLTVGVLAISQDGFAQPIGPVGPIQQIPPAPTQPKSIPDIRIERNEPSAPAEAAGPRIVVRSVKITGATRFSEAALVAAAGFRPGDELDLAGLRRMAARITEFYGRHGYFLAQAYLPAQEVADGTVTITVIEGRYGKVVLDNKSRVSDRLAREILEGLDPGDIVAARPLERRLLLLSDLPAVGVKSTLTPGDVVGTSDMLVELAPGRRVTGSVEADNAGNRYTGTYRAGGTIDFNEPFGQGDVASLRFLTSGSGLNYVRGSYQAHIQEATVGVAYAHLSYKLKREFKPLNARGTFDAVSAYASYPLIRSRPTNLDILASLEARRYEDKAGTPPISVERTGLVASLGLAGDHHDRLWGDGWTSYSVYWSFGDVHIETPLARALDAATARTEGAYHKVSFQVARLQAPGGPLSFYGLARGQLASDNLDPAEKMELGGAYGVRAYPEGEAFGDQGYILTAEARLRLAAFPRLNGQLQAVAFVDHGWIEINRSPWISARNHRTLSAAGVGLTWADSRDLMIKISCAFRLGDERAISAPDRSPRVWVQLAKFF